MFKLFKDKLAEEMKSSPQRLQQFAQAAQAAVTSASSSISDITNNDLFSIGDNDSSSKSQTSTTNQSSTFGDVSPNYQGPVKSGSDLAEITAIQEESYRQRRLSNSSLASDISFRLPSYESPSMYHLQSDMEVSASEAEETGFLSGTANLDRVTKGQLYSAYRHTQDRCKKYKTQYADLARHYKLLERENAKAKNVLVETQDKALRRISELREQCSLEQSAKAHLERALRIEIDEKNMKIHTLNTKLDLLKNNPETINENRQNITSQVENESEMQLINLNEIGKKDSSEEALASEISILNNKLEKMEQLSNKYKESLKVVKEKNAQMTTEIQILSSELQTKSKECDELRAVSVSLSDSKKKIQELNNIIEELQNKCNTYEFTKNKETSILEINLQSAQNDIAELQRKIEELKKKEEEYAISLAENKLSIHKELESKEAEIKSLKDSLTEAQNEIQSLNIVIDDHKSNISALEAERLTLNSNISDYNIAKTKINNIEIQLEELKQKNQSLENSKAKLDEQYKCLQLQMSQETAEKLAMIDRNSYLESRNAQLTEENAKKSSQIHYLEQEMETTCIREHEEMKEADKNILQEISIWKEKYQTLETEIQEERDELIKLQSEIEKLLRNYELVQTKNIDLIRINSELNNENITLQEQIHNNRNVKQKCYEVNAKVKQLRQVVNITSENINSCFNFVNNEMFSIVSDKLSLFNEEFKKEMVKNNVKYNEMKVNYDLTENELKNMCYKHEVTTKEIQKLKEENNDYKIKVEESKSTVVDMAKKMQSSEKERDVLLTEITVLKEEVKSLKCKIDNEEQRFLDVEEKLKTLQAENENLREKLRVSASIIELLNINLNKERNASKEKIESVTVQYEVSLNEINGLNTKLDDLKRKIESDDANNLNTSEIMKSLVTENRNLQTKLTETENSIPQLNISLKREKDLHQEKMEEVLVLSNNYTSLVTDNEEKKNLISKLQESIQNLTQENVTLKNLSETISVNVNKLESEMDEVRKSHAEIEREKNHLNAIIEQLEKNQDQEYSKIYDKDSQTNFIRREKEKSYNNDNSLQKAQNPEDNVCDADQELLEKANGMVNNVQQESNEENCDKTSSVRDIELRYDALLNEYEILKEENRRFQSDVEGLQIYLAKISKENSILNDKLREYFASGENVPEKNEALYNDIEELKTELQLGKERIDNLIRENSILVEENLELKDQLQSQSYNIHATNKSLNTNNNNNTEQELETLKDKYSDLMTEKSKLETRLDDVEQMNVSVDNNMHQMQVNNEKLRLCNEKLERRLDEALVSLRHLHALQENTELEYLRNILYEYLTGSGTHSLTLAKVLSAVVKFSDSQTDIVLQKEKERQGFLRQMGLL